MQVLDILTNKGDRIASIDESASLSTVAGTLNREKIGALLVKDQGGGIAGIISERDIVRGLAEVGPSALESPASAFMSRSVRSCSPESSTEEIMTEMLASRIRHMPVVDKGALVGLISIGDVVKAVLSELQWMTKVLQDQVAAAASWSTDED